MDLDVLFWLVLIGIAILVWWRSVGEPSRAFSGMWRFRELVWPEGVQEDDDAHWSWARPPLLRPSEPKGPAEEPVAAASDVPQGTYEVHSRVGYDVHAGRGDAGR